MLNECDHRTTLQIDPSSAEAKKRNQPEDKEQFCRTYSFSCACKNARACIR
jgi:hypothetical protein